MGSFKGVSPRPPILGLHRLPVTVGQVSCDVAPGPVEDVISTCLHNLSPTWQSSLPAVFRTPTPFIFTHCGLACLSACTAQAGRKPTMTLLKMYR